jgi:hypothetical protein
MHVINAQVTKMKQETERGKNLCKKRGNRIKTKQLNQWLHSPWVST